MTNSASCHWRGQILSSYALLFLSSFSIYKIFNFIASGQPITAIFNMPFSLLLVILFILTSLYHANLGMEVIFEDYVTCGSKRSLLNGAIKFINLSTVIILIIAMFYGYTGSSAMDEEKSDIEISTNKENEKIMSQPVQQSKLPTKTNKK